VNPETVFLTQCEEETLDHPLGNNEPGLARLKVKIDNHSDIVLNISPETTLKALKQKLKDQPKLLGKSWSLRGVLGSLQGCQDTMTLKVTFFFFRLKS
jgi:hypothetical protein